jgi:hypothetical protein
MAELVDAPASGAGAGNGVEVRVLFWAPFFVKIGETGAYRRAVREKGVTMISYI